MKQAGKQKKDMGVLLYNDLIGDYNNGTNS